MPTIHCKSCHVSLKPEQTGSPCPQCGSLGRELSAQDQAVFSEKARVAKELANKHYRVEPGLTQIIRFSGSPQLEAAPFEPIKLLEVNAYTIPSGIYPLGFDAAPASGVPFPSVIIEVTPEEMAKIERKELPLPDDWTHPEPLERPGT
jgi:hypothetical protein